MRTFQNHLHAFGIKVPNRQRYLLTISTLLLVVGMWYFFVYQSYAHAVYQTRLLINQLKDKQTVLASTEKSLTEQSALAVEKHKEFAAFSKHHGAENTSLFTLAHHNGLQMMSYAPGALTDHGWYTATKITCNLSGTFDQIVAFVDACSTCAQSFGITTCSITQRDEGLQCSCVLEMMKIKQESDNAKK